jgi:hypothetical protein
MSALSEPRLEPEEEFRVPSGYGRCRRQSCTQPPVADLRRVRHNWRGYNGPREYYVWFAYCAEHLGVYNREVINGRVWWRGTLEDGAL